MKSIDNQNKAAVFALFFILAAVLYARAVDGPFAFDDLCNIVDNYPTHIKSLSFQELKGAAFDNVCVNRPVSNLFFALGYYVHGLNPFWFRVVNIIIHVFSAFFLFLLLKTTLDLSGRNNNESYDSLAPFFGALLFLVHPVQTQAVSYIVQRMASMASMFYILALLCYALGRASSDRKRRWLYYGLFVVSGLLAAGSKEIAFTLPFTVFLYEWFFFRGLEKQWLVKSLPIAGGIGLLAAFTALAYLEFDPLSVLADRADDFSFTPLEGMLTQFPVAVHYISLLVLPLPSRLNLDYDFPISHSLWDPPWTLASGVIIAVILWSAFRISKKRPFLGFCIFWFFINLALESTMPGLDPVFEHRLYLPSSMALGGVACFVLKWAGSRKKAVVILCAAAVLFSMGTYSRNRVWADDLELWSDVAAKSPNKDRPYFNLARAYEKRGEIEKAITHYSNFLRLAPDHHDAYNNLGNLLRKTGRVDDARACIQRALEIDPNSAGANYNMGLILHTKGRFDESMTYYRKTLEQDNDFLPAHNNLADLLKKAGRLEEAERHYLEALRINPDSGEVYNNLAVLSLIQNNEDKGIELLRKAVEVDPSCSAARINLNRALSARPRRVQ